MSTIQILPPREPLAFSAEQLDAICAAGVLDSDVALVGGEVVAADGGPHRWTVEEAIAVTKLGIVEGRTELLDGRLLRVMTIGPNHAEAVKLLTKLLVVAVGDQADVWPQSPIELERDSAPEPDVTLVEPRSYREQLPRPEDVFLVIEVADSSEQSDREHKLPRYAAASIPECWLICLNSRTVEVHRDPTGDGYSSVTVLHPGAELVSLRIPAARLPVATLFE